MSSQYSVQQTGMRVRDTKVISRIGDTRVDVALAMVVSPTTDGCVPYSPMAVSSQPNALCPHRVKPKYFQIAISLYVFPFLFEGSDLSIIRAKQSFRPGRLQQITLTSYHFIFNENYLLRRCLRYLHLQGRWQSR